MKKILFIIMLTPFLIFSDCEGRPENVTAKEEQAHIELNQKKLNEVQPSPSISWSLERDNLIKRFKLQNDRAVTFFMYVFIEGISEPVGYYQVNKVSSVNSQLTATQQLVDDPNGSFDAGSAVIESPAEDGSYGSNGDGIFGFTPEDIYIETNMKYIVATVPLSFGHPVNRLAVINTDEAKKLLQKSKEAMNK